MKQRSLSLFLILLFLPALNGAAAEFGSDREGYSIRLTGEWKSSTLLSKLIGQDSTRLTAFRDLTGKTPLVVHILSMENFGDLNFNRQAVAEALANDPKTAGGIRQTTLKIGPCDAVRMEYRRKGGKKILQYLLVSDKRLWSILFVGPDTMTADQIKAIDADAGSFRIRTGAE